MIFYHYRKPWFLLDPQNMYPTFNYLYIFWFFLIILFFIMYPITVQNELSAQQKTNIYGEIGVLSGLKNKLYIKSPTKDT